MPKPQIPETLRLAFADEFKITVNLIETIYGKSNDIARSIAGIIICNTLKQLQIDCDNLSFLEFYRKNIHNAPYVFENKDFTVTEIKNLISEACMSHQERMIAYKIYVEDKTYNEIADECDITEPHTVGNCKQRISDILRETASKLYKH